ncbi:MAG: 2-oxoacid:acceptor oxidoreductase subunit alpha [Candidatus Latescibacteria bacterium]|nr:2-oxoacid:acceptor oxidoreductase subunit alpha [Candidatus Latescibacterota bacterium]
MIRFAGDSGDGMQITGNQFTDTTAKVGNDLATFPDFPAEIRAPAGTRAGVSGFQIRFSSTDIYTAGDIPDVLVAMNAAALIVNYKDVAPGGIIIANTGNFTERDLQKAKLATNPLEDGTLDGYRVIAIDINARVTEALQGSPLTSKDVLRCKNFYVLGLMYWLYSRPIEPTLEWLAAKFAKKPELADANQTALRAGYNSGDIHEVFQGRYEVVPVENALPGTYRNIMGNHAVALGLVAGAELAGLKLFLGSYPITPATDILQHLSELKEFGVITCQMEDEIAGICTAIGASYAGMLGCTTTSGPGLALKTEAIGLAIMTELPLVIVDVQRAGPSTGLPTKVEQADLLQSLFGRNSDAPLPIVSCATPADAFDCAVEACRIAVQYMTPVILLSDNYIANGAEPWRLPDMDKLPRFPAVHVTDTAGYAPYSRDAKLARPWAVPGTPGLEHRIGGLEKEHITGNVSHNPENHQLMSEMRRDKVLGVRDTIPTPEVSGPEKADLLVVGWGSTFGAIRSGTERLRREQNVSVAHLHLRHLWPLAHGLDEIFARYKQILVPELNMGQLSRLLQGEYPDHRFLHYGKVKGKPFTAREIREKITAVLEAKS